MARRAVGPALLLGAAGCADVPKDFQPSYWWRNLSGAYLDERQSPPGLDAPYPHLGQVPARPVVPDAATRAAITASLAGDRETAAADRPASDRPASDRPGAARPGSPSPGLAPPEPVRLTAAPPIRFEPDPVMTPLIGRPAAVTPAVAPGMPGPPPAPSADLLGLPPRPSADLFAPGPLAPGPLAPGRLAPRGN